MKKLLPLLLIFITGCAAHINFPDQVLELPETSGKQWGPSVGLENHSSTEVDIVNDIHTTPPVNSGTTVQTGVNVIMAKGAVQLAPNFEVGLRVTGMDSPSFLTVKYNLLGGLGQTGLLLTFMGAAGYRENIQSSDSTFGSTDANSSIDVKGWGGEIMAGYKFAEQQGVYLTYAAFDYWTRTHIEQKPSGVSPVPYDYDDHGNQTIAGVGYFYHAPHFYVMGEWTYSKVHWPRLTDDPGHGGIGVAGGYIF